MSVEVVVLVLVAAAAGAGLVGLGMAAGSRHAPTAAPGARSGVVDALRVQVLEGDRAALRRELSASHARWARLNGDLSQVLAILHEPARDSEVTEVAYNRLEAIRKGL